VLYASPGGEFLCKIDSAMECRHLVLYAHHAGDVQCNQNQHQVQDQQKECEMTTDDYYLLAMIARDGARLGRPWVGALLKFMLKLADQDLERYYTEADDRTGVTEKVA
jgi:hypothetical protein